VITLFAHTRHGRTAPGRLAAALVLALAVAASIVVSSGAAQAAPASVPGGDDVAAQPAGKPKPPKLPRNFTGTGRYLVPDLNIDVPFTWNAKDGNTQMIAGGPRHRIWFTNLIYNGNFYTYTYKWPGIPPVACTPIEGATLAGLNKAFAASAYVGPEILQKEQPRAVEHWRLAVVPPNLPLPLAEADIYVDQGDRTTLWQLLHFGLQNLYDPNLDEWIEMTSWKHKPGKVVLPKVCR
jgi:hypothetical protein